MSDYSGTSRTFLLPSPGLWNNLCSIFPINCHIPWPRLFHSVLITIPHPLSSLTLGGPAMRLKFGPSSKLRVNEGVGSLLVSLFCFHTGIFPLFPFLCPSSFHARVVAFAANSSKGDIPLCHIRQGPSPLVGLFPSPSMVTACTSQALLNQLRFLNSLYFTAGEIHNHLSV